MTFKFWVTLEFSRRHGNFKPKRFDFCIEYKPVDRTWPFHYQWLELFGLLEEIGIKASVAFLKCFSICPLFTSKTQIKNLFLFCVTDCPVVEVKGKIKVSLLSDGINRSIKLQTFFDLWSIQKQEQDLIIQQKSSLQVHGDLRCFVGPWRMEALKRGPFSYFPLCSYLKL